MQKEEDEDKELINLITESINCSKNDKININESIEFSFENVNDKEKSKKIILPKINCRTYNSIEHINTKNTFNQINNNNNNKELLKSGKINNNKNFGKINFRSLQILPLIK